MNDYETPRDDPKWQHAMIASNDLSSSLASLRLDREATRAQISKALQKPADRGAVLAILSFLGSSFISSVIRELVGVALSHRDALRARELIGQIPFEEAGRIVPPIILRQLREISDEDAYRRMAELLRHLGLQDALEELCERAAASDDEAIRQIALDFCR